MSPRARDGRSQDDLVEIYGFERLEDFLNAYVAHKKRQNPHWTFGIWSKQMNLANRSSITRILKGERDPGEKMLQKLIDHFGLDADRAEYLRCLVLVAKQSDDVQMKRALHTRLRELLRAHALRTLSPAEVEKPLHWVSGSDILMLYGTASPEATTAFLRSDNVEPIDVGGRVNTFLAAIRNARSSVGAFAELHIGFFVKIRGKSLETAGVLYRSLLCDNARLATTARHVWGHPYEMAELCISADPSFPSAASIRQGGVELLRMGYRDLRLRQWGAAPELSDYIAYSSTEWAQCKYRVCFQGNGRALPFDPAADEYWIQRGTTIDELVRAVGFQPARWVVYLGVEGSLYAPEPFS